MAQKLTAALPSDLHLGQQYTIRFCALDPSTGNAVTGVNISLAQMHVQQVGPNASAGPQILAVAPLWVPVGPEAE